MYGTPEHHILKGRETTISYYDWGPREGRPVLFLHATGFHARVWDKTIAHLGDNFRSLAVDARGHGLSGKTGPIKSWRELARDVAELVEHLDLTHIIGVGHSGGGHTVTQVAAKMSERFDALVLVDPVIVRPEVYANNPYANQSGLVDHPVARRRSRWANWQELFHRLENQHPYSLWQREILEDYCRFGLHPADGVEGMELACPPEIEASVYMEFAGTDILPEVRALELPVTVLRAKMLAPNEREDLDFAASPTWEGLAGAFPRGTDIYLPQLTHFIPMQDPALVASTIISVSESAAELEGSSHE